MRWARRFTVGAKGGELDMPDLLASAIKDVAAGAAWPAMLGLFYICRWIAHDSPVAPAVAATQAVSIVLAAARSSGGVKGNAKH
jgi:hypothetical protein